ncbi:MAG: hypothetical protein ACP5XB_31220 [Isosphaeraceae bacterium]
MVGASLVLVLGLAAQSVPVADPSALVEQLGAPRYADREAAARQLEQFGRAAVSALQTARDSRDMEIRTRAVALLHKIEGSLLTQPTLVSLDFQDAVLEDVVETLSKRSGMNFTFFPQNSPRWKSDRISLQEAAPLPFWKAVDRLCLVTGLQYDLELRVFAARGEPTLTLTDRGPRPVYPVSDYGPFRVNLVSLESQRNVGFAVQTQPFPARAGAPRVVPGEFPFPQPRPVTSVQCSVQLQVVAEPRLGLNQTGALRILEARDERGNSLVPENMAAPIMMRSSGYLGGTCSSVLHLRAPLTRPEDPGRTIKVLRGVIPLRVVSRQADPLVVPLAHAAGKSFDKGDLHLAIHEVRNDPNRRQRQIELSIHEDHGDGIPGTDDTEPMLPGQRLDMHQQNIEVIDSRGQPLPWFQTSVDLQSSRLTLTLAGLAGPDLKELRYYRLTETTVEVPFTFHDLLMP